MIRRHAFVLSNFLRQLRCAVFRIEVYFPQRVFHRFNRTRRWPERIFVRGHLRTLDSCFFFRLPQRFARHITSQRANVRRNHLFVLHRLSLGFRNGRFAAPPPGPLRGPRGPRPPDSSFPAKRFAVLSTNSCDRGSSRSRTGRPARGPLSLRNPPGFLPNRSPVEGRPELGRRAPPNPPSLRSPRGPPRSSRFPRNPVPDEGLPRNAGRSERPSRGGPLRSKRLGPPVGRSPRSGLAPNLGLPPNAGRAPPRDGGRLPRNSPSPAGFARKGRSLRPSPEANLGLLPNAGRDPPLAGGRPKLLPRDSPPSAGFPRNGRSPRLPLGENRPAEAGRPSLLRRTGGLPNFGRSPRASSGRPRNAGFSPRASSRFPRNAGRSPRESSRRPRNAGRPPASRFSNFGRSRYSRGASTSRVPSALNRAVRVRSSRGLSNSDRSLYDPF